MSRTANRGPDPRRRRRDPARTRAPKAPSSAKAPGPTAWFDIRRRGTGHLAFSLNRITGLGLVFYLYLHLAVLSQLLGGEAAWNGFLETATTPLFLGWTCCSCSACWRTA